MTSHPLLANGGGSSAHALSAAALATLTLFPVAALAAAPASSTAATDATQPEVAPSPIPLVSFYRRNYFITGLSPDTQAKFQFSLKYDLWPNDSYHHVYFAYTQKSFWDVYSPSAPFNEHNFNPGLVYILQLPEPNFDRALTRALWVCGLEQQQLGIDHESNGEAGTRSRSLNRVFLATSAGCQDAQGTHVGAQLTLWPPFFADHENDDIEQFVGFGELELSFDTARSQLWYGSVGFAARGRKGYSRYMRQGSLTFEVSWRLGYGRLMRAWRFTPYLFAQLFTGYAESLLSYDRSTTSLRLGFGFFDRSDWWL